MWWKILLLSFYLFLLFIFTRILETFTYYQTGYLANRLIDPFSLSVQKLKAILDNRGVSYANALEKQDLTETVENSGELTESESSSIDVTMLNSENDQNLDLDFIGGDHFLEKVEDTKDSVWIIQVLADDYIENKNNWKISRREWNKLVKILSKFGIQAGIFHCSKDVKFCRLKNWDTNQIILSLPEGNCFKDKVVIKPYQGTSFSHKNILKWLNKLLFQKIHKISDSDRSLQKWFQFESPDIINNNYSRYGNFNNIAKDNKTTNQCQEKVRVIFISPLNVPPMFYNVMSAKFSGRIKFGRIDTNDIKINKKLLELIKSLNTSEILKSNWLPMRSSESNSTKLQAFEMPTALYLIITPEKLMKFGGKSGEHYNYKSFSNFLRFLHPEINDIFIISLITMSFACCFDLIFFVEQKLSKKTINFLWGLMKCNVLLICLWMIVLGTYKSFSQCQKSIDYLLSFIRTLCFSSIGTELRNDWYQYMQCEKGWLLPFSTFILVQILLVGFKSKLFIDEQPVTDRNTNRSRSYGLSYLDSVINHLMQPFFSSSDPHSHSSNSYLDDENNSDYGLMEMFIERLAVPNLWLRPIVSSQYLHDLPVWRHSGTKRPSTTSSQLDSDNSAEPGDCFSSSGMEETGPESGDDLNLERTQPFIFVCDKCKIALHPSRRKLSFNRKMKECENNRRKSSIKLGALKVAKYLMDGNYKCSCSHNDGKNGSGGVTDCHPNIEEDEDNNNNSDSAEDVNMMEENLMSPVQKLLSSLAFKTKSEKQLNNSHYHYMVPKGIIESFDCSICLDAYKRKDYLCGLPCGHAFHQICIMSWLTRDNHCCPVCRWPAYKAKPCRNHFYP